MSQDIEDLLQSLSSIEDGIGKIPHTSLEGMLQGLKVKFLKKLSTKQFKTSKLLINCS